MTTSWAHVTRGRFAEAAQVNVGGLLLAIFAAIGAPWALVSGFRGDWWPVAPRFSWCLAAGIIVVVSIALQWAARFWI
jgi:hypothetical protein